MQALQTLIPLIITVSLAGLVVSVGLDADLDDLLYLLRKPLRLIKAVLAVNVIVPIAAVAIVFVFPLSQIARVGVLLMAVSPVPPLVPGKEIKVGGSKPYSYSLYAALSLLAIIIVPLTVEILSRVYGVEVSLPVGLVARNVALTVLLPLAIGLIVRRLWPNLARRALPVVTAITNVLLIVAVIPLLIVVWPAVAALVGNGTILAMALTAGIALMAGHMLGGPELNDRAALAMTAVTRHPGIALMIANANHADRAVTAAILAVMLVGLIVAIPYQLWIKRRAARPSPAAAVHG